jgi:hypothetical protein
LARTGDPDRRAEIGDMPGPDLGGWLVHARCRDYNAGFCQMTCFAIGCPPLGAGRRDARMAPGGAGAAIRTRWGTDRAQESWWPPRKDARNVDQMRILGFAGSLRRVSYNRGLIRAAADLAVRIDLGRAAA